MKRLVPDRLLPIRHRLLRSYTQLNGQLVDILTQVQIGGIDIFLVYKTVAQRCIRFPGLIRAIEEGILRVIIRFYITALEARLQNGLVFQRLFIIGLETIKKRFVPFLKKALALM
jgi:hypothetical protein